MSTDVANRRIVHTSLFVSAVALTAGVVVFGVGTGLTEWLFTVTPPELLGAIRVPEWFHPPEEPLTTLHPQFIALGGSGPEECTLGSDFC